MYMSSVLHAPVLIIQYNTTHTTVHEQVNDTHLITKPTLRLIALCRTEEAVLSAIKASSSNDIMQ